MIDTWMGKMFHMAEHSAVLTRLNRICRLVGLGDDVEPVRQPSLSHEEFADKVEGLIRTVEGQPACLKMPQSSR